MKSIEINSRRKKKIKVYQWEAANPKASIVIAHGASEHILRYSKFAQFLSEKGVNVYGYNHVGHAENKLHENGVYFGKNNGDKKLVDDLEDVCKYATKDNLPLFVFGHSMGSLVVRAFSIESTLDVKGIIICGSMQPKAIKINGGLFAAKVITYFSKETNTSKFLNKLVFGSFEGSISFDESNVKKYREDFECGQPFTNQAIIDLLTLTKFAISTNNIKKMKKTDYLIISGAKDSFSDNTKQLEVFIKELEMSNFDFEYHFYENMKHEILNEKDSKKVYTDVSKFIKKNIKNKK